jgi:Predicted metal-dependent hydrolase
MLQDTDFGTIEFVANKRAKCIRVRILPKGLRVTLPVGANQKDAIRFIDSIRQKLIAKQRKLQEKQEKNAIFIDENSSLRTLTFRIEVKRSTREGIFFSLKGDVLYIEIPQNVNCADENIQSTLWNGINYFLRKEAKRLLPQRTAMLAKAHNFSFSSVKIQSSKSRWGSCSSKRNINLSFYLLLLPQHLIDYVILHELCHTKEMNHSAKFWELMNKATDNKSDELNKELKKYSMP